MAVLLGGDDPEPSLLPLVQHGHLTSLLVAQGVQVVVDVLQLLQRLIHRQRPTAWCAPPWSPPPHQRTQLLRHQQPDIPCSPQMPATECPPFSKSQPTTHI